MLYNFKHNIPINLKHAEETLMQMYTTAWKEEVDSKVKLKNFSMIKDSIKVEPYIKCNCDKYQRSLVSQLRSGVLSLEVESGRFQKIARSE